MEENALEFKNMCPYILPDNDVEDEADECVYITMEKMYQHTVLDLEHRDDMEFFTPQYKLMYEEMVNFFKKSRRLRECNKYLQSELASTIAELQAMQRLSAIDKEMIEQLKEEMERKWDEQTLDEENNVSKQQLEQIKMLSVLINERDEVINEQKTTLDSLTKMKDYSNEQSALLMQENENLKQELENITKEKQNMEEYLLQAEEKFKEVTENLQAIDAELLQERNGKEQLRNEVAKLGVQLNAQYKHCVKLEEELQKYYAGEVNVKEEDYRKLCAEFESANVNISELTELTIKKEEEIKNVTEKLNKAKCDMKLLEKTVNNLQESNDQLTREKKELATLLQQYEKKYKSMKLGSDSFIQAGEGEKCDQQRDISTRNIFDKLTEQCEKQKLQRKASYGHLRRYTGTLSDVIKGLEKELADL